MGWIILLFVPSYAHIMKFLLLLLISSWGMCSAQISRTVTVVPPKVVTHHTLRAVSTGTSVTAHSTCQKCKSKYPIVRVLSGYTANGEPIYRYQRAGYCKCSQKGRVVLPQSSGYSYKFRGTSTRYGTAVQVPVAQPVITVPVRPTVIIQRPLISIRF